MNVREVLGGLSALAGPSGFEAGVAERAAALLRPYVDDVCIDPMQNVFGVRRCGRKDAKKLLFDAHLDEIGLVVTAIEEGFLRFRTIGGVDPRMLPARELTILTDPPLYGVVACLPPHVQTAADHDASFPIPELCIDVGLTQEEAEARVPIGTPAVYRGGSFAMGEHRLCGKSMDDRACFTTLLRAAELLKDKDLPVDLYIMGSTREEVGGMGAMVGTYGVAPDCCVAVDVTHGLTPDAPKTKTLKLGEGASIGVGPNMTRWMTERMVTLAKEREIKYHLEVMEGHTGTNGWEMQITREGIATCVVSLPLRYMHTPVEVLDLGDVEAVSALLAAFAETLTGEVFPC